VVREERKEIVKRFFSQPAHIMASCITATAEHPLEGSLNYCKHHDGLFPAFLMRMAE